MAEGPTTENAPSPRSSTRASTSWSSRCARYNCLKNASIQTIGELVQKTETEMLKTKNFGRKSLNEIKEILGGMGLGLGMKLDDWPQARAEDRREDHETPRRPSEAGADHAHRESAPPQPRHRPLREGADPDHPAQGEGAPALRREAHHPRQARGRTGSTRAASPRATCRTRPS